MVRAGRVSYAGHYQFISFGDSDMALYPARYGVCKGKGERLLHYVIAASASVAAKVYAGGKPTDGR